MTHRQILAVNCHCNQGYSRTEYIVHHMDSLNCHCKTANVRQSSEQTFFKRDATFTGVMFHCIRTYSFHEDVRKRPSVFTLLCYSWLTVHRPESLAGLGGPVSTAQEDVAPLVLLVSSPLCQHGAELLSTPTLAGVHRTSSVLWLHRVCSWFSQAEPAKKASDKVVRNFEVTLNSLGKQASLS